MSTEAQFVWPGRPSLRAQHLWRWLGLAVLTVSLWLGAQCAYSPLRAQVPEGGNAFYRDAERMLLQLDLDALRQFVSQHSHPVPTVYYQQRAAWLRAWLSGDTNDLHHLREANEAALQTLKKHRKHPLAATMRTEVLLGQAWWAAQTQHPTQGVAALRQAWETLLQIRKAQPNNPQHLRTEGLLRVALALAPDAWAALLGPAAPQANLPLGIALLERAADSAAFQGRECRYWVAWMLRNWLCDADSALRLLQPLLAADSTQALLQFWAADWQLDAHTPLALDARRAGLNAWVANASHAQLALYPQAVYQLGHAYALADQADSARHWLRLLLDRHPQPAYRTQARWLLGLMAWWDSEPEAAQAHWQAALAEPQRGTAADSLAAQRIRELLARHPQGLPDTRASRYLRAEWLLDAGHAEAARTLLAPDEDRLFALEGWEKAALHYLLGTYYQRMGLRDPALLQYRHAITQNCVVTCWQQPAAALQIGLLNRQWANWQEARRYFDIALGYPPHPLTAQLRWQAQACRAALAHIAYVTRER